MDTISDSELPNQLNLLVQEEVFSNHLIVHFIWKHLGPQDLLRASLVSVRWCAKSREVLKLNKKKHPVCIQLSTDSPCRQLAKFNEFLEEISYSNSCSSADNIPDILNGILHRSIYPHRPLLNKCGNCLIDEWKINNPGIANEELEELIQKNMLRTYGRILEKIQFKYLRFPTQIPLACLLARFIKFVLRQQPENIVEIDFGLNSLPKNVTSYFFGESFVHETMLFPNLEIFGIYNLPWYNADDDDRIFFALPLRAPLLKKILHFPFNPTRTIGTLSDNFPRHAIIHLDEGFISDTYLWSPEGVQTMLEFITEFQPKIETIRAHPNAEVEEILSDPLKYDLFQLGFLISATLTSLLCPIPYLPFLSGKNGENGGIFQRNSFPSLQNLMLVGPLGVDFADWSLAVDVSRDFPKLRQVSICFDKAKNDCVVSGPFNMVEDSKWGTVSHLKLGRQILELGNDNDNDVYLGFIPTVLNMFPHIRHLDLAEMNLSCNTHDETFALVMNSLDTFLLLEEITVKLSAPKMRSLCLDHLFLENIQIFRENLVGMNFKEFWMYKTSVLNHKALKRINIHGNSICTMKSSNINGETYCHSSQRPGIFLVTSRTAELICKYRPGFTFRVRVSGNSSTCSNSDHRPGGFFLEHLEPFAKISSQDSANKNFSKIWDIEFQRRT